MNASDKPPEKWSLSRSTLPYLLAALLASTAMAWYFFAFVPPKLEYFVGLKFRTLAVASGQVKSKVESLSKAFQSVPTDGSAQPGQNLSDKQRQYLELVVPQIQINRDGVPAAPGLLLTADATFVSGTVIWSDVVAEAAAATMRDFDDLLLAESNGDVVWQRETSTPRIGNLTELLGAADDAGGSWSLSWNVRATTPVVRDVKHLRSTAHLKPVSLGGTSSLLLVQAITMARDGIQMKADEGKEDVKRLYVAGLTSRAALQRQARRLPAAWLVIVALPVVLLFLALPFVKLATLTQRERYSFADLVLMIGATVAAAALGAMVPFVSTSTSAASDGSLERFGRQIEQRLANETDEVLALADRVVGEESQIQAALSTCAHLESGVQPPDPKQPHPECGLWKALAAGGTAQPAPFELDVVVWFDARGEQLRKWTTKAQVTGRATHRAFDHYRDVTSDRLWTLVPRAAGDSGPPRSTRRFTIDPLRAPTTSELGVIVATPASESSSPKTYLALNLRPRSVVDPVVPPGYGFAIVAPTGRVLFHSEEGLSLQENFYAEVGAPDEVHGKAESRRVAIWSGDYHGRPHRLRMQPVTVFAGCPWRIVTFQEMEPLLAAEVDQQSGTLRLGALNLLLLTLLGISFGVCSKLNHRRVRDLVPTDASADPRWVWLLVVLAVIGVAAILATYFPFAYGWLDDVYGLFVALPVIAILVALVARLRRSTGQDSGPSPATHRRLLAAELALLVLLVAVLPAAGFARLVSRVQDVNAAERWLESAQQRWSARQTRVRERINSPNYTSDTRELLRSGFAADSWPAGGDPEPIHSYLRIVDGVGVEPATSDSRPLSRGQGLLRWLLELNLLGSRDVPSQSGAVLSTASNRVALDLVHDGQQSRVALNVVAGAARVSGLSVLIGLLILGGSLSMVYWARRKFMPDPATAPQDVRSVIAAVPRTGNEVVLLIGPPRTKKDEMAREAVAAVTGAPPVARIRLLDATVDDTYITKRLQDVKLAIPLPGQEPPQEGPLWIHVSNLETQLTDEASRTQVLHLLERLLELPTERARAVIVTTSVDPIAHFKELFSEERKGIYKNVVPEVELSRSALLLSRFRRCYAPIGKVGDREAWLRESWALWRNYAPANWRETLQRELQGYGPLAQIRQELEAAWRDRDAVSFDELVRAIRTRAVATYELLWTSCTRAEKLVLIQLAQEGFVTPQSRDVVAPLVAKGLIVERTAPAIFNYTFGDFLRRIERNAVIQEWERMEGHGLWVVTGRLIGSTLLAGGVFFLLTQNFSVQSLLPIVSGTGMFGAPLVRTLLARMSGKPLATA
jgi:hypothetical protein